MSTSFTLQASQFHPIGFPTACSTGAPRYAFTGRIVAAEATLTRE